jgi:hypothetical protein
MTTVSSISSNRIEKLSLMTELVFFLGSDELLLISPRGYLHPTIRHDDPPHGEGYPFEICILIASTQYDVEPLCRFDVFFLGPCELLLILPMGYSDPTIRRDSMTTATLMDSACWELLPTQLIISPPSCRLLLGIV